MRIKEKKEEKVDEEDKVRCVIMCGREVENEGKVTKNMCQSYENVKWLR